MLAAYAERGRLTATITGATHAVLSMERLDTEGFRISFLTKLGFVFHHSPRLQWGGCRPVQDALAKEANDAVARASETLGWADRASLRALLPQCATL
jgi:hypothetical protein